MSLLQKRPPAVRKSFDDVRLPQRPAAVHPSPDDARNLLRQLISRTRRRESDVAHVVVKIEMCVLDPVRPIQFERDLDHPSTQRLQMTDHDRQPLTHRNERIKIP